MYHIMCTAVQDASAVQRLHRGAVRRRRLHCGGDVPCDVDGTRGEAARCSGHGEKSASSIYSYRVVYGWAAKATDTRRV